MLTTQQREQRRELKQHKRETLNALIGEQLIHRLGEPDNLLRVQVRRLWKNHYRVNVFLGADAASARIADSYFLQADGDGNIIESTPKITKHY
jgi:hypothetical protein